MAIKYKEYTLYDRHDEVIAHGTIKDIAKVTGLKEKTLYFYTSPSQKKRLKRGKILV